MGNLAASSLPAVTAISEMITPALLILASASLVASALVRMARVVDRTRILTAAVHGGGWEALGTTPAQLSVWLKRHAKRARDVERSIILLYAAVVMFIATSLAIAANRALGGAWNWLPLLLAIIGTFFLLSGGLLMVSESRSSGEQIAEEIHLALARLTEKGP